MLRFPPRPHGGGRSQPPASMSYSRSSVSATALAGDLGMEALCWEEGVAQPEITSGAASRSRVVNIWREDIGELRERIDTASAQKCCDNPKLPQFSLF